MFWGYHLLLDCKAGDLDKVTSKSNINNFIHDLVPSIGMRAYGDPIIEHFATHLPEAAGYSLLQLIETSSITGHFSDKTGDHYIDVFSCKEFNIEDAISIVKTYFNPTEIRTTYLTRQA
jgi:S-adenosylmethionine/arginine decarboxylase-like enzyme